MKNEEKKEFKQGGFVPVNADYELSGDSLNVAAKESSKVTERLIRLTDAEAQAVVDILNVVGNGKYSAIIKKFLK